MTKNDNLHLLFTSLNGCLPYEYNEKLNDHENTLILTKENSDYAMYISPDELDSDDFIVTVTHNDPVEDYYDEYETFHWTTEDEQIPLTTIISDIEHYL